MIIHTILSISDSKEATQIGSTKSRSNMQTNLTLGQMLENSATLYPGKIALVYEDWNIRYRDLNEMVNRLANGLIGLGLQKGGRVGTLLTRRPELVISFLATARAGGILVPLNFSSQFEELDYVIQTVEPTVLILHQAFQPLVEKLSVSLEDTQFIVVDAENQNPYFSWETFLAKGSCNPPSRTINAEEIVYFNYTSGSTGKPKAAMTTHSNILWNTISSVDTLGLKHSDVHLIMFAPYAHPHELFARPIYLGGALVLLDNIYPKSLAKTITEERVTCMMGLAPMYEMLLSVADSPLYDLSSLWLPESGGMSTKIELLIEFEARFNTPIVPVWGSTETTGIALATPVHGERKLGSVGKPCLYYEVKVVDDEGEEVGPNEVGEMAIKGPAVVERYFDPSGEMLPVTRNGWYYTDDFVMKDEAGYFYFMGRKQSMLKVGGMKVFPAEIENFLQEHPKISTAVVVGVHDKLRGEVPKAIILLKPGKTATETEIREFCQKGLANYKVPRGVEFRDELPRTPSGKINRKVLEEEAKVERRTKGQLPLLIL